MALVNETVNEAVSTRIGPQDLVDDVMRRWPQTIGVFMRARMKCIGCPFGPFHTIAYACEEHAQDEAAFIAALERAIQSV
jgi:hybrid cluster-associated redox disulfide protein